MFHLDLQCNDFTTTGVRRQKNGMNNRKFHGTGVALVVLVLLLGFYSCKKDVDMPTFRYYEVGFNGNPVEWRDSSFVVATSNAALIEELEAQLALPVAQRKIVTGALVAGSGGYNKNASHQFQWHFKEDNWQLTELSAEIYDGRPYSDIDNDIDYWMNTLKRFAPWGSYIKKEIPKP